MPPFSLWTGGANLLAKSLSAWSCTNAVARYTCVLHSAFFTQVKCLSSQAGGPPKKPPNGYLTYSIEQRPIIARYNPAVSHLDISKKIGHQWRMMSPEQKRPFEEAALRAMQQYKLDLQQYLARLTPAEIQQKDLEKSEKLAKKMAIRKKREWHELGKPKRSRTALNIFLAEYFSKARGNNAVAKLTSVTEAWRKLPIHQKQVYIQLAEDDRVRYKNEMKSWEDHMVEIGREDLLRGKTLAVRRKGAEANASKEKSSKATKTSSATTARRT